MYLLGAISGGEVAAIIAAITALLVQIGLALKWLLDREYERGRGDAYEEESRETIAELQATVADLRATIAKRQERVP